MLAFVNAAVPQGRYAARGRTPAFYQSTMFAKPVFVRAVGDITILVAPVVFVGKVTTACLIIPVSVAVDGMKTLVWLGRAARVGSPRLTAFVAAPLKPIQVRMQTSACLPK
jgi:hypothetical protein